MSVTDVVTFVSVGIVGGAFIQYPLGYLSDRWSRRTVLMLTAGLAMTAALALSNLAGSDPLANFVYVFVFGCFAMPMFSLAAAHANDRADKGEFVLVNAALMLFYSFGAIGGPYVAALSMQMFGPSFLFTFNAIVYAALILIILYRMVAQPGVHRPEMVALHRAAEDLDDLRQAGEARRRTHAVGIGSTAARSRN